METAPLDISGLSCILRSTERHVVDDVSLRVETGARLALVGPSGCGKSTLLRAVLGLLDEETWEIRGTISIFGQDIIGRSQNELRDLRGRLVRCVFQEPTRCVNPAFRAADLLAQCVRASAPGLSRAEVRERVEQILSALGLMEQKHIAGSFPVHLSAGQRQRLGVAVALAAPAPLLLCDEMTSYLDSTVSLEVIRHIQSCYEAGTIGSMLAVSHDMHMLRALGCEWGWVMQEGCIGEMGLLVGSPRPERPAASGVDRAERTPLLRVTELDVGHPLRSFFGSRRHQVLESITFDVLDGEALGIAGESGSGKTTLAHCLAGLLRPYDGTVLLNKASIWSMREDDPVRAARSVGVLFQDAADGFDPTMTIAQNLEASLAAALGTAEAYADKLGHLLRALELPEPILHASPMVLSGGEKQRLAIARAVLLNPTILVADEPFTHLDTGLIARVAELLREFASDGRALVVISHDLGLLVRMCDRLLVLSQEGGVEGVWSASQFASGGLFGTAGKLSDAACEIGSLVSVGVREA